MGTIARSVASGLTDDFSLPFTYILTSHVKVWVDEVLQTETTDYVVTPGNVALVVTPTAGQIVERRRVTPKGPLTVFGGGDLDHDDLNAAILQANYIGEEAYDANIELVDALDGITAEDIEQVFTDAAQVAADRIVVAADKATVAADKATVAADKATVAADKATVSTDKGIVLGYRDEVEADRVDVQGDKVIASAAADTAVAAQAAAEAALASTLAAYDSFDDRYLGVFASDPTLDNDGNALVGGALYFDSVAGAMKVYTGAIWTAAYVGGTGVALLANNGSDYTAATFRTNLDLYATGQVDTLLAAKAPLASPTFTGTVTVPDASFALGKLAQGTALSVVGVTGNAAAAYADIAAGTDGHVLRRVGTALSFGTLTIGAFADNIITYAKLASASFATAAEYFANTASKLIDVATLWSSAAPVTVADGATITANFNTFIDAETALGGNRTLGAPSNMKNGQKGVWWFTAVTSTRTLTLNAAYLLFTGVETGPYSVTTSQVLGLAYVVRGGVVYITAALRRG